LLLERPDGSQISFYVDRAKKRQGAVLLLQGSGCEPVAGDKRVLAIAPLVAPGSAVVTIEKYGVTAGPSAGDLIEGCTADYWRGNTLSQRVADAVHVVARLRQEQWWNGDFAIVGGSEGGAVAAMAAPLIKETRGTVIFSSGIGVPVGELILGAVPPPVAAAAPAVFAEAKANPSGTKLWGGASYRWWADAVDLVPARMLLQTKAPILLIHGSRDQFALVRTARATRDLLARHGRRNFTYREYDGYDHFMRDAAGTDHRAAVLRDAGAWLLRQRRR
jgi:alpha-beta hydrolase superfamily lysophospholipase